VQELSSETAVSGCTQTRQICFRVGKGVKEVWDSLPKGDKLVLTAFFKQAIANYGSLKSVIPLGVKDLAELANLLKAGFESCKDALRRCEERCRDVEEVRSEYRAKMKEYEERIEQLRAETANKDAEMAKLRSSLARMSSLNKLRLLVCSLMERDKDLRAELERNGLLELCK